MDLFLIIILTLNLAHVHLVQGSVSDKFNYKFMNSTLKPIDIGGLFNAFDTKGRNSSAGAQQLAAFLMAVREINDKNDGVYDDLLPDYYLRIRVSGAHGYLGAVQAAAKMEFSDSSPIAVISGLHDTETIAATHMLEYVHTISMSCTSTSSELSKGQDFPYKVRTVASESFGGVVLQDALYVHLGIRRLVIFSTSDYFSSQSLISFTTGEYGIFEILAEYVLEAGLEDYTEAINGAISTGGLVFVLLTDPETTSVLLVQGNQMGLFGLGRSVYCHDFAIGPETAALIKTLDPLSDPGVYLKGVIAFEPRPLYPVFHQSEGQEFLRRWSKQNSTLSPNCSNQADDFGQKLYSKHSNCAGLNFSSLHELISSAISIKPIGVDEDIGTCYDSVTAIANALHYLLYDNTSKNGNSTYSLDEIKSEHGHLMEGLLRHVNFRGVTDMVSFSEGQLFHGHRTATLFGRGDRYSGLTYSPTNYNATAVGYENWVDVGRWDTEGHWQLCDDRLMEELVGPPDECLFRVVYNTVDGKRPPDRPPVQTLIMNIGLRYLFIVLSVLGLLFCLLLLSYFWHHRASNLIKASQPPMMLMVLIGELCIAIRVLFSSFPVGQEAWTCHGKIWLGHLGFGLLFGGLFLKMWRVDKIVNTTSLKRVKITNNDISRIGVITSILLAAYLGVISGASGIYSSVVMSTVANQDTLMYTCSEETPGLQMALFVIEFIFIVWGIRLCNATKNAPSVVNESQYIALSTLIICVLCLMVMPIVFLVGLSSVTNEIIQGFAFTVCIFSTLFILFFPKVVQLYNGDDVDSKLKIHKVAAKAKVHQETSSEENSLVTECSKALKSMVNLDEKHKLCVSQIEFWRNMLVAIEERRSSGSGSGSATSAAAISESKNMGSNYYNRINSAASNSLDVGSASQFSPGDVEESIYHATTDN